MFTKAEITGLYSRREPIASRNGTLLIILLLIIIGFAVTGIMADGPGRAFSGFTQLQFQPARLISDFTESKGIGAALLNSAAVGAVGLAFITCAGVRLSGPTFAAVLTMMGFALFGKTPLNITPVILGVLLAGKAIGRKPSEYMIIALFGTALGPIVSLVAFEMGLSGLSGVAVGVAAGLATGFLLPSLAVAMLHFHQGYNLYNLGMTCGFFALFAASLARAGGHEFQGIMQWHTGNQPILVLLVPVMSAGLIMAAMISGGWGSFRSMMAIQKHSGRLPSDFMDMESMSGALLNAGLVGLAGSGYILLVGGDFNGPTLGGLLTIIGFGAFGTHLRNSWPVVVGVVMAALLFGKPLTAPGVMLAAIFCTTLGPLAGKFGILIGMTAGFIHLFMVYQTGSWQGTINLYNNGFAGGLTATFIVSVIAWYETRSSSSS